jgi:hypothetical protein
MPDTDWVAPPLPGDTGGPVLDGPVRSPSLPAIAGAAHGRPRSLNPRRRLPAPSAATTNPGRGAPRPSPAPPIQAWSGGRRPVMVVVGVALLAVLALAMSVALTRPASPIPWTLDNPQFITDANQVCTSTLASSRPSPVPAITSGAASPSPSVLIRWAGAVNQTSARIRLLSSVPDDIGRLNIWLGEWGAYSADESRYASWLQHSAKPATAAQAKAGSKIMESLKQLAEAADSFANSNGLGSCTLA